MPAPKNVKQPDDHKQKATAKDDVETAKKVEFHGRSYTVDLTGADDIDIMDMMADAKLTGDESNTMAAMALMTRRMLGDDYARFKTEQRAIHGKVGSELLQEFFTLAGQGNS